MDGGGDFMNEVDCNTFFDQMDDLVEFPADTDSGFLSGGSSDISGIWSNPLPYEDIAQLEWLSNFVEDSFSDGGLTMTKENSFLNKDPSSSEEFQTASPVSTGSSFSEEKAFPPNPTQRGVRTKRPRPATFNAPSFPVSRVPSENEITTVPYKGKKVTATVSSEHKKKKKMKPAIPLAPVDVNNKNTTGENVRKCLHCEITKTPQWRAGPMGPKTLCNACGVRYKSGRLFPEYRPAASPTFVASLHSNSHRKVVEMRTRCAEGSPMEMTDQPELIPNTSTPSFDCI